MIAKLENRRNELVENFQQQHNALTKTIDLLKEDLKYKELLDEAKNNNIFYPDNEFAIINGNTLAESVINLMKHMRRFLHISEITEMLHFKYHHKDKIKLSRQLSGVLSRLNNDGRITIFRNGKSPKKIYWGLKEWLNENGTIKQDYRFIQPEKKRAEETAL